MSTPARNPETTQAERPRMTPVIEPGLYLNDELADKDFVFGLGVSQSALKDIARSPLYWRERRYKETAAMTKGTLIDEAVLEPHKFDRDYLPVPDDLRRGTKAWKEQEAAAAEDGRTLVKQTDYDQALAVREALYSDDRIGPLLEAGARQPRMFWRDEKTTVMCKGKADLLIPDLRMMIDLKTTPDVRPEAFAKSAANLDYPIQDAFYRRGYRGATKMTLSVFAFLVVEPEPPYDFALYELEERDREIADARVDELLALYADCVRRNYWPGIDPDRALRPLPMPYWWRKQHQHVIKD